MLFPIVCTYTPLFRSAAGREQRLVEVAVQAVPRGGVAQAVGAGEAMEGRDDLRFPRRVALGDRGLERLALEDRKSTRLNSSHLGIAYAVVSLTQKSRH